ncbi:MAG: DUF1080 domain-containing protein [Luteitalea sp.]|nr:DUF1080 domain-containing protein [Luteitalea sp.]
MRKKLMMVVILASVCGLPTYSTSAEWVQLFNGTDMTGWQHVGEGSFVVEDGALKGIEGMGLLWYTRQTFGNCVIRVVYKGENDDSNSGLYIRIPERPTEPMMPVRRGHEIQIAGDHTGELFGFTKATIERSKPEGGWNLLEVTIDGPRTVVKLNRVLVTDYTEGSSKPFIDWVGDVVRPNEGYIGVQNHEPTSVYFREIAVKPLEK